LYGDPHSIKRKIEKFSASEAWTYEWENTGERLIITWKLNNPRMYIPKEENPWNKLIIIDSTKYKENDNPFELEEEEPIKEIPSGAWSISSVDARSSGKIYKWPN